MLISRTPLRVSLLGGGLDFPCWYLKHGGLVIGGTINRFAYITARYLPPFHGYKTRLAYSAIETVQSNNEIQHRAIKACLEYFGWTEPISPSLEISHLADLPGRSGTGSSSTFVVGLLNALAGLQGRLMSARELAEVATKIEQDVLEETVGCQDQVWAAYGGFNIIKFATNGEINVYPIGLDAGRLRELEEHLLLFFTGIQRTSSEVARSYAPTLGERNKEQWAMMRLAEDGVNAIQTGQWEKLGKLIDQSWRIKSGLSPLVTNTRINDLYATARILKSYGGKITGAGAGGCLLLVVNPDKRQEIIETLEPMGAINIPFKFHLHGSQIIFMDRNGTDGRNK